LAVKPFDEVFRAVNNGRDAYKVFSDEIYTDSNFFELDIPEMPLIIEPWLRENYFVMISAQYGIGKTWFILELATIIAKGGEMGQWRGITQHDSLIIDGEMLGNEMQARLIGLGKNRPFNEHNIHIICSMMLSQKRITSPNFADAIWQNGLIKYLDKNKSIKVIFFDNVSSLVSGIDENSKQDWDPVNQFFLRLKGLGLTVILVHHHGKETGKGQRGTISRLDNVDIHITLTKPPGYNKKRDGAKFIMRFDKARGITGDAVEEYTFQLKDLPDGEKRLQTTFTTKKEEAINMMHDGKTNKEIVDELQTTDSYVSRIRGEATNE